MLVVLAASALVALAARSGQDPFATLRVYGPELERSADGNAVYLTGRSGEHLAVGNHLRTDPSGRGQVDYDDRSVTRLDRSTHFVVEDLGSADRAIRVHLETGRAWNKVERLTGTQTRFRISTPNAVATVRGTTFDVACNPQRTCVFVVLSGRVLVEPRRGAPLELGPMQSLTIGPDGRVVPPRANPGLGISAVTPADLAGDDWFGWNSAIELTGTPPAPSPQPTAAPATDAPITTDASRPTAGPTVKPAAAPPGGGQFAFLAGAAGQRGSEVYVMRFDGTGIRRVTTTPAGMPTPSSGAVLSPDGTRVAFVRGWSSSYEIHVVNIDGGGDRRLTDNTFQDYSPTWSPDGTRIVFASNRTESGIASNYYLWTMSAVDGSGQTRLTKTMPGSCPQYAPDGSRILFGSNGDGGDYGLFTIRPDGSAFTRLTRTRSPEGQPSWSKDPGRITFQQVGKIWVANADGTGAQAIVGQAGTYAIGGPLWSWDGLHIAFTGRPSWDSANVGGLWLVNPDGSDPRNLIAGTQLSGAKTGC